MKVLNKNSDTWETDASTMSKHDNRSPSAFNNKDTKTEITRAQKKDTNSFSTKHELPMTRVTKSIFVLQKVALTSLDTSKEWLEKWSISPDQGGFSPHLATGAYTSLYFPTATVLSGVHQLLTFH